MAKEITIDDLATMVARGFEHTATKNDIANMATKDDIANMATKDDIAHLDTRLDKMDTRLDRIENLLIRDHTNRIERLEDISRQLQVKLGLDLHI